MTLNCTKCFAENSLDDMINGSVQCRGCQEWFEVPKSLLTPVAAFQTGGRSSRREFVEAKVSMRTTRDAAVACEILSGIFLVIAILLFGWSIKCAIADDGSTGLFTYGGSGSLATCLWLYLIAQIIHIRANTEK